MSIMPCTKVVIIQRLLAQYRRLFYELLRERLAGTDIELILIHGFPINSEVMNKFACSILDKYYFAIPCIIL